MAGLALLLQARGHEVTGCDARDNRQVEWLRSKGIPVWIGHDPAHLQDAEWIIRTAAFPATHGELAGADQPIHRRGEVLPELVRDRYTVAVSGSHGKTTVSSMIAQILQCGYCIGGEVPVLDGTARDGDPMVVEADESDGTIALYHPDITVVTNIEYDHMEHHASAAAFESCFEQLIANTRQKIIYCARDPVATRLCADHPLAVPYGADLDPDPEVSLPGAHNRLNARAVIEVCRTWMPEADIHRGLRVIQPVRRRFEIVATGNFTVVSDYAHHPTEIRTLVQTAHETLHPRRVLALFQPHRYTRTRALLHDFPPAFEGIDLLGLLPVYAASEDPIMGGGAEDLFRAFPAQWKNRVFLFQSQAAAWQNMTRRLRPGDALLLIGAGDIDTLADAMRTGTDKDTG